LSSSEARIVILHDIMSPYRTTLFNAIHRLVPIKVCYFARTQDMRDWKVSETEMQYSVELLSEGSLDQVSALRLFWRTWRTLSRENPTKLIVAGYYYSGSWAGILWAYFHRRPVYLWASSMQGTFGAVWIKERFKSFLSRKPSQSCHESAIHPRNHSDPIRSLAMHTSSPH